MRKRWIVLAGVLYPAIGSVQADEPVTSAAGWSRLDAATLSFTGTFSARRMVEGARATSDDGLMLMRLTPDTKTLVVNASGGSVQAAAKVGRLVRQYGLDVVVRGECRAACAYFVAGAARRVVVEPGSSLVFNNPFLVDDGFASIIEEERRHVSEMLGPPKSPERTTADIISSLQRQSAHNRGQSIETLWSWGIVGVIEDVETLTAWREAAGYPVKRSDGWVFPAAWLRSRYGYRIEGSYDLVEQEGVRSACVAGDLFPVSSLGCP